MFALPWEDSISILGLGSLARLTGFVVAGCWLGTILLEGKFRKPNFFHALVLLFILWNFLSIFWSLDVEGTLQRIKTYSQIFLLILIYWEVFQKPEELMAGLQTYISGAYILVGSTIYNYLAGNVAVQYEGRYSATGVNANDVALNLILGLPIGVSVAMELLGVAHRNIKGVLLQVIDFLYIPLSIFSIVLTGSRTSLIAIIPFIILMVGTQRIRAERKILISVLLIVSLLALSPFVPQTMIDRLGTIGDSISEADLGGRVNLWREGIAILAKHSLLGIGGGAIDHTIGAAVHNTFISVATETGFIGLVFFLSILGLVVYKMTRLPARTSGLWWAVFLTWMIGVFTLSWEFRKFTWIILSFVIIESSFGEHVSEKERNIIFSGGIRRSLEASQPVSQKMV